MYDFRFLIGELHIEMHSTFSIKLQSNMLPFEEHADFPGDIVYYLEKAPYAGWKPEGLETLVLDKGLSRIYRTQNGFIKEDGVGNCQDWTIIKNNDWAHPHIFVSANVNQNYSVGNSMSFPITLSLFDGVFLHASFIRWQGKGILFTGPSGIGKTTQANLWKDLRGAEILNGDKTIVRCREECWFAYGSPWAGSSQVYRNERAPLQAIIVLEQAQQNKLIPLGQVQAFKRIFHQSNAPLFDSSLLFRTINLLEKLVHDIPVYLLKCRPDEEAVKILENCLLHL